MEEVRIKGIIADSGFYLKNFIELLKQKGLTYIIAALLYQPLQRKIYVQQDWKEIDEGICITEFYFRHEDRRMDRRYIAIWQDIKRRQQAMEKELSLFGDDFDMGK